MVLVPQPDPLSELSSFLLLAKVGRWILRQDFSFVWSPEMYDLFGLSPGCSAQDVVAGYHPDDRNYVTRAINRCFASGQPIVTRYRIVRPGGEVRQVFSRAVRRQAGQGHELIGVNVDVTEQMIDGIADAEEARRYRFIAENARDLIIRYDPSGLLTFASPASRFLLGHAPEELVGRNVVSLLDPSVHPDAEARLLQRGQDGRGPGTIELCVLRADGTTVWLEGNPRPATNAFGEVIEWVDVVRDIGDRKRAQAALVATMDELTREKAAVEHGATHDYLTGLANRALFHRRLEEALAKPGGTGAPVLFAMDLDRFKYVNDTLGHAAGDGVLVQVAERLRRTLPSEALVARLGGDEFAAILPGSMSERDAVQLAHEAVRVVSAPYVVEGQAARIGMSVGIATGDDSLAESVLRRADTALYRAKSSGRNAVNVFDVAPIKERTCFSSADALKNLPVAV